MVSISEFTFLREVRSRDNINLNWESLKDSIIRFSSIIPSIKEWSVMGELMEKINEYSQVKWTNPNHGLNESELKKSIGLVDRAKTFIGQIEKSSDLVISGALTS